MSLDCCRFLDENIMPYADFLHTPTSFPITKKATKSYLGIFLSFLMIFILILLSVKEILSFKRKTALIYSQNFIKRNDWEKQEITFGFNVSEEWKNEVFFNLVDANNSTIELKRCNEDLKESPNGIYYCILNSQLKIDYNSDYTLKIYLRLKKNLIEYEKNLNIPFTLSMREPIINPDNYNNIIDLTKDSSIQKYRSVFNTMEITSHRRYLKLIRYVTKDITYILEDNIQEMNAIYLDDFQDSKELPISDAFEGDGNLLGTYRLMVSKKIDIYERKYDYLLLVSKIGGYIGTLNSIFSILCLIMVNPNDDYRIVDYLKKNYSIHFDTDLKSIYDDSKNIKKLNTSDFNDIIMDNRSRKKFCYKFCYFFCRCFDRSKRARSLSVISQYIQKNLTIENYLESQILTKELLKNYKKIDELKAKYFSKYKRKNLNHLITIDSILLDMKKDRNKKEEPLMKDFEMENKSEELGQSTEAIDNNISLSSFNEKEREDIIKIILETIF